VNVIDSFSGDYRFLSNFYPSVIIRHARIYDTVEHAYQAAKTNNQYEKDMIRRMSTPGCAKKLGKQATLRYDWDDVKLQIMFNLVSVKFTDPRLIIKLKATKNKELIEGNTWGDIFWGMCGGVGENHLGKILMNVRSRV